MPTTLKGRSIKLSALLYCAKAGLEPLTVLTPAPALRIRTGPETYCSGAHGVMATYNVSQHFSACVLLPAGEPQSAPGPSCSRHEPLGLQLWHHMWLHLLGIVLQEGGAQGRGLAMSRPQLFLLELVHSGEEHTGRDLELVVQIFRQSFLPSTELEIFAKSLQASSDACQEPVPDTISWLPMHAQSDITVAISVLIPISSVILSHYGRIALQQAAVT